MRESQRATVYFKSLEKKKYNPDTGRMEGGAEPPEILPCFVSNMGVNLQNQLLDKLDVDAKIIRFNKSIARPIERIEINDKTYQVINYKSFYQRRGAIMIREVMRNGKG